MRLLDSSVASPRVASLLLNDTFRTLYFVEMTVKYRIFQKSLTKIYYNFGGLSRVNRQPNFYIISVSSKSSRRKRFLMLML